MQCHVVILDTTGTTYIFYEVDKRKETIEEKTKTKKTNRKRKRKKMEEIYKKQSVVPPPAGEVANI